MILAEVSSVPTTTSPLLYIFGVLALGGLAGLAALWKVMATSRAEVDRLRTESRNIDETREDTRKHLIDEAASLAVASMKEALATLQGEVKRLEGKLENANGRISHLEDELQRSLVDREDLHAKLTEAIAERARLEERLEADRKELEDLKRAAAQGVIDRRSEPST